MVQKFLKLLFRSLILFAIFLSGIALGTYYQNEIRVFWRSLFVQTGTPAKDSGSNLNIQQDGPSISIPGLEGDLPLVFTDTLEEEIIQEELKRGAVVLPLGTSFGESGNVVVTAHSTGTEAFGPYRFAFAKLSELEEGDEYTVSTAKATYTYKVYAKEIVWPHEVDKLPNDDRSTVTLVTCWPLWTNFKRLLVHTELINTEHHV